jgi:hypothetical protein
MSERPNPTTTDMTEKPHRRTEENSDANRSDDATPEHQFPASPLPLLRHLRDRINAEFGPESGEDSRSGSDDVPSAKIVPERGEATHPPSTDSEREICRYCGCPIDETAGCPARASRGCEA